MTVSIVIPVWNGADVIAACLDAVRVSTAEHTPEVICVDNASNDGSAALIAKDYAWVRLIQAPVNLGFAGGANAGIEAASGDLFVLLNQDCIVHTDWLEALQAVLDAAPSLGVAGCTILRADGSVDHTGAVVRRPDATGIHSATSEEGEWATADFVTGAAMAIRRTTWERVGAFDEGFYPAYYEDADYCYRARHHGIKVGWVAGARVTHLFSNKAWQKDPVAHTANQHRARYRFVGKHFESDEIAAFAAAEVDALQTEAFLDQVVARAIAARDSVRCLSDVMARRQADLGDAPPTVHRQMAVTLHDIRRLALAAAGRLLDTGLEEPPTDVWQQRNQALRQEIAQAASLLGGAAGGVPEVPGSAPSTGESSTLDTIAALQDRETDLVARIHFHPTDAGSEGAWWRRFRHTLLRAASVLTGREDVLQTRLHTLAVQQLDLMARQVAAYNRQVDLLRLLVKEREQQDAWQRDYDLERLERRLNLLETLAEHD